MWRHQTKGWLVILILILTQCSYTVTGDTSPGDGIPSLAEAIEILKIDEIVILNRKIAEKDIEKKKKEDENQNLRKKLSEQQEEKENVIHEHVAAKGFIEEELKGSRILVKFMMNALHHSQEMMKERETAIAQQAEMVEKAHAENVQCKTKDNENMKLMFESQETIRLQNDNIEKMKNILKYTEALNVSYHELEEIKSCDLPAFVSGMSDILSNQENEIEDLKAFLENEKKIKDYLESIKTEITKEHKTANQSEEEWEILKSYQTIISKQSESIGRLSTIASYGANVTAAFRYEEDKSGNLVSASSCQCLPDVQNGTKVSVVLGSQDQRIMSLWSPWKYQDCFEWKKPDNSTADCGFHGKKVRSRVKELDSVSWEEETEEEACGECRVPELQVGSWSEWMGCENKTERRRKMEVSGHTVSTVEETRDCLPDHPQCSEAYTTLSDDWRKISYSDSRRPYKCDKTRGLTNGWYRFTFSGVNAYIPLEAAPTQYRDYGKTCGTYTTAWMEGTLPTVSQPPQNVKMYFTRQSGVNRDTIDGKVVACTAGGKDIFYLYYLVRPDECDLAYCATTTVRLRPA